MRDARRNNGDVGMEASLTGAERLPASDLPRAEVLFLRKGFVSLVTARLMARGFGSVTGSGPG
jgi:hypothetical protein